MKLLRLIANGADCIADSYVDPRIYERPAKDGFIKDGVNLRGDVLNVGKDMRAVINKNVRAHQSSSSK